MLAVILTIHTILVIALVGVVLLQRSEGGALGMGGGGGGGGFMSGRGAANALTRTTTVLAACFFITSLALAVMGDRGATQADQIRSLTGEEAPAGQTEPGDISDDDILDIFGDESETPAAATEPGPVPEAASDEAGDEPASAEPENNGN